VIGLLVFFSGQTSRIANLDETDGLLDNTAGQRGGRKPIVFYCHGVNGSGTQANKSSHSPTTIMGLNADGEALPPHFQLKTAAKKDDREKINADFIMNCHNVYGTFGHGERKLHHCTYGLNERAGMNTVELEKHTNANILPLHPDVEDVPLKRIILKVDSGPGRLNVPMLAALRLKGVHVVARVPNTTSTTQETDQSLGPFKTPCRGNLATLAAARFEMRKTLRIEDLPIIVFGGKDPIADVQLENAMEKGFNQTSCLKAWLKCGAVPPTMSPLESNKVRHECIINEDGSLNVELDPKSLRIKRLEGSNHVNCNFLSLHGMDGNQLRINAPRQAAKKFKLTEPHSKERVEATQKAKGAGQLFHVTQDQHSNSEDFFAARAKTIRDVEVDGLEKKEKEHLKHKECFDAAKKVLAAKGEPTTETIATHTAADLKVLYK